MSLPLTASTEVLPRSARARVPSWVMQCAATSVLTFSPSQAPLRLVRWHSSSFTSALARLSWNSEATMPFSLCPVLTSSSHSALPSLPQPVLVDSVALLFAAFWCTRISTMSSSPVLLTLTRSFVTATRSTLRPWLDLFTTRLALSSLSALLLMPRPRVETSWLVAVAPMPPSSQVRILPTATSCSLPSLRSTRKQRLSRRSASSLFSTCARLRASRRQSTSITRSSRVSQPLSSPLICARSFTGSDLLAPSRVL
mmetsp:Transcript_12954/g.25120  ORF Transcript_12954/g.25120 Transcript_12954/m.25120 type:complete len:255 (-) Transcript_12954:524-1288(-)